MTPFEREADLNRRRGWRNFVIVVGAAIVFTIAIKVLDATVASGIANLFVCSLKDAALGFPLHNC